MPTYDKSVVKLKQQADIKYETKRFNSSFSTIKYVFDNQSLPIKLEDTHGALLDTINVTFDFVYNKELSNSFAFKFNSDIAFRQYGDFSE